MPTKELCFFIQQRNNIRSGLTNDVSVFLPFDLASRTGIGDARILSAANGIPSTKASPKQLNQCWPVEDEEAAKCTNDAKENVIKNHLSWRVWETSFYSLFSLSLHSFICLRNTTNVNMCTALNKHDNEINEHLQTFSIYFTRKCKRPRLTTIWTVAMREKQGERHFCHVCDELDHRIMPFVQYPNNNTAANTKSKSEKCQT